MTAPSWTTDWPKDDEEKSDNPILRELDDVKSTLLGLDRAHRVALNEQIVRACVIGTKLRHDWFNWLKFIEDEGWRGMTAPKDTVKHRNDAVRHVLRWVCGSSPPGRKRASFYYRAVDVLLSKGVKAEDLLAELNKPGQRLRVLATRHAEKKRAAGTKPKSLSHDFAPRKQGKRWVMPVHVEFDREPSSLIGLAGDDHNPFTMRGCIEKLDSPNKLRVLAWSFKFDFEDEAKDR